MDLMDGFKIKSKPLHVWLFKRLAEQYLIWGGKQIQSIEEITEKLGVGEIVCRRNIELNIEFNP